MAGSKNSPEYQVIHRNRTEHLAVFVNDHLTAIAKRLRDCKLLTEIQCNEVTEQLGRAGDGGDKVVGHVLFAIETNTNPCDPYINFVDILERCGNEPLRTYLNDVIKPGRKRLYRDLLKPVPGTSSREYDVFVSYGHQNDTNNFVDNLAQKLRGSQLKVFVDRRDILPGDRWPLEIVSAIQSSKVFISVLTKRYVRSLYCNGELYEAEALGKHLFPVVFEDEWDKGPAGAPVKDVVKNYQYAFCQPGRSNLDEQYPAMEKNIREKMGVVPPPPANQGWHTYTTLVVLILAVISTMVFGWWQLVAESTESYPKVGDATVSTIVDFPKASKPSLVGPCNSYPRMKINNDYRPCRYFDSRGSPIIGVGHNLQKQGSEIQIKRIGADYRDLLNGILCLNEVQIEDLFNEDMSEAVACVMNWLEDGHWKKLSESAQSALVDMAFNMGCGGLKTFKRLREALVSDPVNYVKAQAEMKDSKWCRQVKIRCDRDVQCMVP